MRHDVVPSRRPADYPFHHRIRIRFAETDAMGIVHHRNHLLYLEEARVEYLRHLGRPYAELRRTGVDLAVLDVAVQYRAPLRFDEELDVHLALVAPRRATFSMAYALTVGDQLRATAVTSHGCVGAEGRAARMPSWLIDLAVELPT